MAFDRGKSKEKRTNYSIIELKTSITEALTHFKKGIKIKADLSFTICWAMC